MQVEITVKLNLNMSTPGDVKTIAIHELDRALRTITNAKRTDNGVMSYSIPYPKTAE
jgi:hypothetical protein